MMVDIKKRIFTKTLAALVASFALNSSESYAALAGATSNNKEDPDHDLLEASHIFADRLPGKFLSVKILLSCTGKYREYNIPVRIQVGRSKSMQSLVYDEIIEVKSHSDYFIGKIYDDNDWQGDLYIKVDVMNPIGNTEKRSIKSIKTDANQEEQTRMVHVIQLFN